jgi:tetratricopeptide (TPR) repeat protein
MSVTGREPQPMSDMPAPRRARIRLFAGVALMATAATALVATAIGQSPDPAPAGTASPAPASGPLIVPTRQLESGVPTSGMVSEAGPAPAAAPAGPGQTGAAAAGGTASGTAASGGTASGTTASGASAPEVDDSALRYFLQQGDTRRAQAELQRLHRLYPNWEPPANLFDPNAPMPSDVQPIWDLYGAGDYAAARRAVAERQAAEPGWTPPAELVAALEQVGERQRLLNAADGGQWETVLSIADSAPAMLTCDNIEVLWRIAEAFARTGAEQRAVDVETYIVGNCPGAAPKVASLQKALEFLPIARIEALLARAVDPPATDPAYDVVRLEIARRQISAANDDPSLTVPAPTLALLATAAQGEGGADDALLLGFYAYRHGDAQGASGWFLYALQHGGGAKAAEGYVLSMHELGRQLEAEPVAYEWRTAGRENMAAYLTAITTALTTGDASLVEQPVLDRFSRTVAEQRSPLGAQALGWYAYNAGQPQVAADWFSASLAWHPSEVAAYGLGLAYRALEDGAAFREVLRTWVPSFPRLPELYGQAVAGGPSPAGGRAAVMAAARRAGVAPADAAAMMRDLGLTDAASPRAAGPAGAVGGTALSLAPPSTDRAISAASTSMTGPATLGDLGAGEGAGPRRTQGIGCGGAGAGTVAAGWCLMEQDRPFEAAQAFSQAGGGEAAFGAALAYLRMGLTRDAALAAARAPLDTARRRQIETSLVTQVATDAYQRGKFTQTLEALDQRRALAPEQNDLMMLRGWSYYEMGDFISARQMFEAVDAVAPTPATRRALNTVNLRMTPRSFRDQ